ncbi:hypothetical protein AAEU32_08310 [Pseudoalteromonas sp. SSDWG2]|uniref:hypothetical protein n=1 Tax=Pseudoalteromonas sp. SSDWG2 TaxID=3139391 RepID=UPI003BA9AEA1
MHKSPLYVGVLVILILPLSLFASELRWKIASLEWPPYASAKMANGGDAIAALRTKLEQQGITLDVDYLPWDQAQIRAAQGDYIGYYPAWPSEVKEGFSASEPLGSSSLGLLTHKDKHLNYQSLVSIFEQYKVGVVSSYVYPDTIQSVLDEYKNTIRHARTEQGLVDLLMRGDVELILATAEILEHSVSKKQFSALKMVKQFADIPLVVALRNTDTTHNPLTLINDAMQQTDVVNSDFIKPTHLSGTYIKTPGIEPFIEFIKHTYAQLGIELKLEPVPARRGLVLLNAGLSDMDVVRVRSNMGQFNNIMVIEPSLAKGEHILLCDKTMPCNLEVLDNPKNTILTGRGTLDSLAQFNIKARTIINEQIGLAPALLKRRDVEYVLFSVVAGDVDVYRDDFNVLPLRTFHLNHVVSKELEPLIPQLQKVINATLGEFSPQGVLVKNKSTAPEVH